MFYMDMSIIFRKQLVSVSALMSNLGIQIGTPEKGKLSLQLPPSDWHVGMLGVGCVFF